MGIFDNELILPGAITEITSDFSYGYETDAFGSTDSVTVIGTAFNGPTGKPMKIHSPEHAAYVFGEAYDYKTRREATLVAEIKDAWDRGCRTIYAVRVSGKEIYKDFSLIPETKLKLRVAGLFPSNKNKDIYMVYDNTLGAEKIKLYKPASRATLQEKREGLVDTEESVLVATLDIAGSLGLTRDSRLVELITTFNEYYRNNVLRLTIVDENGADATVGSKEAQGLSIGALFPGAYFIGRSTSTCVAATEVDFALTTPTNKPYENFDEAVYKVLKLNTDVNAEYPIYGESISVLNDKFDGKVQMSKMFDFLEVYQKADVLFQKDKIDYEEVELENFDYYKRLGSGYAVTAKAETVTDPETGKVKIKRVVETPVSDPSRIMEVKDGVYSMIEGLRSDYRVLTGVSADTKITGKLPRKSEFEIRLPLTHSINDMILATSKVEKTDKTTEKKFKFQLKKVDASTLESPKAIKSKLYTKTIQSASLFETEAELEKISLKEGTIVLIGTADAITKAGRITNGVFVAFDGKANAEVSNKLIFCNGTLYSMTIAGNAVTVAKAVPANIGAASAPSTKAAKATTGEDVDGGDDSDSSSGGGDDSSSTTKPGGGGSTSTKPNPPVVPPTPTIDKYVLVDNDGSVFIYRISGKKTVLDGLVAVGPVAMVLSEDEDKTLITVQSSYNQENIISVQSTEFDYITVEELVNILNEDRNLQKLFTFELASSAFAEKDTVIEDAFGLTDAAPSKTTTATADKEYGIDTNLYIPYKTTDNFARHLAQHCKYTSLKTAPTHGVIGCSKLLDVNYVSVAKKVDALLEENLNLYAKKENGKDILDANNMPYPIGHLVSVVFGQHIVPTLDGYTYISNGAAGYAGMVSVLPIDQSSTNQPISLPGLMFELTNYQLEKLTQKGIVTFKQSYTKGIVVTDGVTLGNAASPFRRLSTARIISAFEELIREATEPFIGKQNHLANRNSMQTAIKSNLDTIKGRLINSYKFRLIDDPTSEQMGIINIEYSMVPVYEIREIRNKITVTDSL